MVRGGNVVADPGDGPNGGRERRDIVQQFEPNEVVWPACEIPAVIAGPDQDAVTGPQAELTDLNVGAIVVERDFATDGDPGLVRADFI